jgi:hypothetical protein
MRHVTSHYQSDFEVDKKILHDAALSGDDSGKYLLWMCGPAGTHCLSERDIFVRGTYAHNTFAFYYEQTRDPVIAYAVEVKGVSEGKVMGDLYELNYSGYYHSVMKKAVNNSGDITLIDKRGNEKTVPFITRWGSVIDMEALDTVQILPDNPEMLENTLKDMREERHKSENYEVWDPDTFCPMNAEKHNGKTVFVLMYGLKSDDEELDAAGIYSTLDLAYEAMEKDIEKSKRNVFWWDNNTQSAKDDYIIDSGGNFFEVYNDGFYADHHESWRIEPRVMNAELFPEKESEQSGEIGIEM